MAPDADEQVQMLQAFTEDQLSYDQAVRLLRISNNDINLAVNKFLDQGIKAIEEDANAMQWDQAVFDADRYGRADNLGSNIPSFNIEYAPGVDHYPHSGPASVAPSRPPSRTSHHSAASPAYGGDTPMQSIESGQETGLIGSSAPVFGPANRDYYEEKNWAMVPLTVNAEFIPDASPSNRKREEDGPAIIKPLPTDDYLPALITILHSIPLYRNSLLAPEVQLADYSVGEDWWKGGASPQGRTVDYGSGQQTAQGLEIIYETQRLMAFLDSTDRAYGSAEGLRRLDAWQQSSESLDRTDDELLKFLVSWGSVYQDQTSRSLDGVLKSVVKAAGQNQESFLLDATVVHNDSTTEKTLYDVLDDNLFASAAGNAHIVDISNVVILRLTNAKADANGLDCKFPAIFYADRYLEENKPVIDEMLQEMEQYQDRLKELDDSVYKLKYHKTKVAKPGEQVETLTLLKTSMLAFQPKEDDLIEDPSQTTVLAQLQAIYENIEHKLSVLEEQKKKTRETLDHIAARFRAPFDEESETTMDPSDQDPSELPPSRHPLAHPYKLCGVSTRPGVLYLLHPNIRSNIPNEHQWWRIEYSTATGSEAYILRERLSLSSVLEKLSTEHSSALAIYANDAALSTPPIPLSAPLTHFVKADNVKFLEELSSTGWEYDDRQTIEPIGGWDKQEYNWPRGGGDALPIYAENAAYNKRAWSGYGQTTSMDAEFPVQRMDDFGARQGDDDADLSSTTLTPNTEIEDEGIGMEMDVLSEPETAEISASSDTLVGEVDQPGPEESVKTVNLRDVEMRDVGDVHQQHRGGGDDEDEEERVRHIERLGERRGG